MAAIGAPCIIHGDQRLKARYEVFKPLRQGLKISNFDGLDYALKKINHYLGSEAFEARARERLDRWDSPRSNRQEPRHASHQSDSARPASAALCTYLES